MNISNGNGSPGNRSRSPSNNDNPHNQSDHPVIAGSPHPHPTACELSGGPQIGKDFYINRDDLQHNEWGDDNDGNGSFSSLSGGVTTMSKVVGESYGGLLLEDVENAGGDAVFDAIYDNTTILSQDEESFDYIYNHGFHTSNDASGIESSDTASEGRSSLSSLTTNDNDFALGRPIQKQLVPTFDDRGRFSSFGCKGSNIIGNKKSSSKSTSKQSQMQLNGSPSFEDNEIGISINIKNKANDIKTRKNGGGSSSPWYSSARAKQQIAIKKQSQSSPARSHAATHSNTEPWSSVDTTPPSSPIRHTPHNPHHSNSNLLGNDFVTSMEHIDSLVQYCPTSTLPTNDSRIISSGGGGGDSGDADSNNCATDNTYDDNSMPSDVGFGTYVYTKFADSSRRKKMFLLFALVMLVMGIAATLVGALGGKQQGDREDVDIAGKKNYIVEQVEKEMNTDRGADRGTDTLPANVPSDDYLDSGDGLDDEVDFILPVEYVRVPKPSSSPIEEDADGSSIGVPTDDDDYLDSGDDLDDDEVDFILHRSKKSVPKPKKGSPTKKHAHDDYQDSGDR